jgi:hypothetical protein
MARKAPMAAIITKRMNLPGRVLLVSHAYAENIHQIRVSTSSARPSSQTLATRAIRWVTRVIVKTNTKSKNSSMVETRTVAVRGAGPVIPTC